MLLLSTAHSLGMENNALRARIDTLTTDLTETRLDYLKLRQQDECRADPYVCMIEQGGV